MPPRFRFVLLDGSTVTGVVQGLSGPLHFNGGLPRLITMQRKHLLGRLPRPAQVRVFPEYSAASDGPCVIVDLGFVTSITEA